MLLGFLATTTVGWVVAGAVFGFGSIVGAAQAAAWQLKWVSAPVAIAVIWGGLRSLRSIKQSPTKFGGRSLARAGFSSAVIATLLVGTLIGITVPERLRRREWAKDAADRAPAHTLHLALLRYRERHGTYPPRGEMAERLRTLPDPDGSIAELLRNLDTTSYEASSVLAAAAPKSKGLPRGAATQNVSLTSPDAPPVSFTNYELRLPGQDKKFNTEDDLLVRDGLIQSMSELRDYRASRSNEP